MSDGDLTVLVVNWSTPDDLERCVESAQQHERNLQWLVYQNAHPTINSIPTLQRLHDKHDDFYYINGLENKGHGAGINKAAHMAAALFDPKYLFIVNPDVVWKEPVLDRLVAFLEADEKCAAVGPKQIDSQHRITAGGIIGSNETPKHRHFHMPDPPNSLDRDAIQCPMVAGSAFLTYADDFHNMGGLLESKHYYSETWYFYHLRAHGRTVWYYGEPWMIHEWHRSSPMGYAGTDGAMKEDRELFRKKCDSHEPPIARD